MSMSSFSSPFITSSGLEVTRVWSLAGVASSVFVKGHSVNNGEKGKPIPRESFLFDCGNIDEVTRNAKNVFISHGHTGIYRIVSSFSLTILLSTTPPIFVLDHIGALVLHARCSALRDPSDVKYYVPKE